MNSYVIMPTLLTGRQYIYMEYRRLGSESLYACTSEWRRTEKSFAGFESAMFISHGHLFDFHSYKDTQRIWS